VFAPEAETILFSAPDGWQSCPMIPILALAAVALTAPLAAQDSPEPPTPVSIVAGAPAADWRAIDPADLLVMTLAADRDGHPRQVVIQLLPPPLSQPWVGNVRQLARAHWWDGTSVYRVVDNWVAQWGDGEDDETKAKPLPAGLVSPVAPYDTTNGTLTEHMTALMSAAEIAQLVREGASSPRAQRGRRVQAALNPDSYAERSYFFLGWPIGLGGGALESPAWPTHCYGSVGVARDIESTGTGAELYAVIGHAPRQLDRNIAVVGRVIEGIEHLATLPRGKGEAGVYDDPALRVPIVSVRLGDELPAAERPGFEVLGHETESFARYVEVRGKRSDAFYKVPAGGIDVCNVQVPIRRVAAP
jgi:peptidylprolyl isomerase